MMPVYCIIFLSSIHFQAAWLCLAEIGSSSNKLDHSFVVKSWNEYSQGLKGTFQLEFSRKFVVQAGPPCQLA